jgi:hypothetical protein
MTMTMSTRRLVDGFSFPLNTEKSDKFNVSFQTIKNSKKTNFYGNQTNFPVQESKMDFFR